MTNGVLGVVLARFGRRSAPELPEPSFTERIVLNAMAQFPKGATADDVMSVLPKHFTWRQITPRFATLMRKGWIEDTGTRRLGSKGRYQRVLRLVKKPRKGGRA